MRGWHARGEAGGVIVDTVGVDAHIDDALIEITALSLDRIAIWQLVGRDLGGGIAVRLNRRRNCFNLRRAMRAIALRHRGDSAGLQRQADPHSHEQADYSGPGAP